MSARERLAVGRVRGLHGLRGGVRVEVLTDRPEHRFRPGARLYREGSDRPLTVASATPAEPGWLIRFDELPDRSSVDDLRGAYLEALVDPGEELARGEYYWHEVIGATVVDIEGRTLGTVVDVYRAGGAEVFVVRGEPYGEFDLPAVRDFIRVFAPRRGEIVADVAALELTAPGPKRPRGRRSSKLRAATGGTTAETTAETSGPTAKTTAAPAEPPEGG